MGLRCSISGALTSRCAGLCSCLSSRAAGSWWLEKKSIISCCTVCFPGAAAEISSRWEVITTPMVRSHDDSGTSCQSMWSHSASCCRWWILSSEENQLHGETKQTHTHSCLFSLLIGCLVSSWGPLAPYCGWRQHYWTGQTLLNRPGDKHTDVYSNAAFLFFPRSSRLIIQTERRAVVWKLNSRVSSVTGWTPVFLQPPRTVLNIWTLLIKSYLDSVLLSLTDSEVIKLLKGVTGKIVVSRLRQ